MPPDETSSHDAGDVPGSLLRLVADSVPALMAYYEYGTLRCRFANRRYAEYNGWTAETILGKTVREAIGEKAWTQIEPHVEEVIAGRTVRYVRAQTLPDGSERVIEVNLIPHFSDAGPQIGAFVLINDITEGWHAQRELRESEERLSKFMQASSEAFVFHREGEITDVNDAVTSLIGYLPGELIGRRTIDFVAEEWHPTVLERMQAHSEQPYEAAVVHRDGRVIPVELVGRRIHQSGQEQRLVVARDITARKLAQARIEFLALHDPLTELPNRLYAQDYLPRTIALARRQGRRVAVMFIDLDGFKPVNDAHGHEAGDAVLCAVASRFRGVVRESDMVARLGGDEFLVVLTDIAGPADVDRVAAALLEAMRAPVVVSGRSCVISMSIGVSLYPEHGGTGEELVRQADAAMYTAKVAGGSRYSLPPDAAAH